MYLKIHQSYFHFSFFRTSVYCCSAFYRSQYICFTLHYSRYNSSSIIFLLPLPPSLLALPPTSFAVRIYSALLVMLVLAFWVEIFSYSDQLLACLLSLDNLERKTRTAIIYRNIQAYCHKKVRLLHSLTSFFETSHS